MNSTYPKTLESEEGRQVVALSENFTPRKMTFLRADLSGDGAELIRFHADFAPNFTFSPEEADAFCTAWLEFRHEQHEAELAEIQRQEAVKEKALAIAEQYANALLVREILEDNGKLLAWVVKPAAILENSISIREWAYTPDDLLYQVQQCKEAWEQYQRLDAEVEKAFSLVEHVPGLSIYGNGDPYYFIKLYDGNVRDWLHREDLFQATKEVIADYLSGLHRKYADLFLSKLPANGDEKPAWRLAVNNGPEYTVSNLTELLPRVQECINVIEARQQATA